MIEKDKLAGLIKEEAAELLSEMESALLELETNPADIALVNRVFRAMHTVKGAANMFGLDEVSRLTHEVETVYDAVRNGRLDVSRALLDSSLRAKDIIWELIEHPGDVDRADFENLLADLRGLLTASRTPAAPHSTEAAATPAQAPRPETATTPAGPDEEPVAEGAASPKAFAVTFRPGGEKNLLHVDPLGVLDELSATGQTTLFGHGEDIPPLEDLDPEECRLWWEVLIESATPDPSLPDRIRDAFIFVEDSSEVAIQPVDDVIAWNEVRQAPRSVPDSLEDFSVELRREPGVSFTQPFTDPESLVAAPVPLEALTASPTSAPSPAISAPKATPGRASGVPKPAGPARKVEAPLAPVHPHAEDSGVGSSVPVPHPVVPPATPATEQRATVLRKKEVASSVRVDAYKLDDMVALVGELVIAQARLSQIVSGINEPSLQSVVEEMELLSNSLRDRTLSMRMLPIGTTFDRFRRLVRDLSQELDKEIELVTQGADTELDKTVIEQLGDPLVHLLRNSIDHGIEQPEVREAAGKPRKGTIVLSAEHSGGHVLIRIFDNGKGLDRNKIAEKAVERGLITDPASMSDKEIFTLIFHPGFSTAEKVTNVSGRGVGMDVVKKGIEGLRGSVDLDSQLGVGTTVTVKLPLTLAIIEGLQVRVADEFYVLPLSAVQECVELTDAQRGRSDDTAANRKKIINLRNEIVPYIRLREWFDISGTIPEIEQIIITGDENTKTGIVVDEVIGQQQTVIKSLGRVFKDVQEISGATIKGDGTMALILDIPFLVRKVMAGYTSSGE